MTTVPDDTDRDAARPPLEDQSPRGLQSLLDLVYTRDAEGSSSGTPANAFEACLRPLLTALNWSGRERRLFEVMPHLEPVADMAEFRAVLHRLGFAARQVRLATAALTGDSLPAVIERPQGPVVVISNERGRLQVYDGASRSCREEAVSAIPETVHLVSRTAEETEPQKGARGTWFWGAFRRFKQHVAAVVLLTFLTNVIALATPIYVASVYNHVIGANSLTSLVFFCAAIALLIAVEFHLRHQRASVVAFVGARFHAALAIGALEKVMLLPISMIEQSSVASQIGRFRQFEGIRQFFTGHLVNAVLDLPFTILFLIGLGLIGGPLVVIPVLLCLVFAALAVISVPITRRNVAMTGAAQSKSQAFLMESLTRVEAIRHLGAERIWADRHRRAAREAVIAKFKAQIFDSALHAASQSFSALAGIGSLAIGSVMVMNGTLSIGGLIAVMMLIWRLLAPIQTTFLAINNLGQFVESIRQVNALMRLNTERNPARMAALSRNFKGNIKLEGIAFRYGGRVEPALRNISLDIPAGQIVAVSGPAGSGKSTLLKMILGFYPPAAGTVYLDGLNLQQIDLGDVRVGIGYVPQDPVFFFGTLAQNLRMADPTADDQRLKDALAAAGLDPLEQTFADGLDTPIRRSRLDDRSEGTLMRLALARAYVKRPSIYLLDDPGAYLDRAGDEALIARLNALRGNATVLIVTSRPSHMRVCDRVIRMERGMIVADGVLDAREGQSAPARQAAVHQRS